MAPSQRKNKGGKGKKLKKTAKAVKPEKPPAYALVFYLKDKSTGVVMNSPPTLSEGKTFMSPLPIDPETREPPQDSNTKLKAKVLKLGHNPDFLYGFFVNLQGAISLSETPTAPEIENQAPRANLESLRKEALNNLELQSKMLTPIFGSGSKNNSENLSQNKISPSKESAAVSTAATTETVTENSETHDEGTAVSKAATAQKTSEKAETPVKPSTPESTTTVLMATTNTNIQIPDFVPSSSSQHSMPGPSFQNNAGFVSFQNQNQRQGNGGWPCLIEDPSKMRIVHNINVFAKRSFVNSLAKVVPQTAEYKRKKIPPRSVFGTAMFPRGMTNHLLQELVPPELASDIKLADLPDEVVMVQQIAVNSTLERSAKATDSDFNTWVSDFGRNYKRDRKTEMYSVCNLRKVNKQARQQSSD